MIDPKIYKKVLYYIFVMC